MVAMRSTFMSQTCSPSACAISHGSQAAPRVLARQPRAASTAGRRGSPFLPRHTDCSATGGDDVVEGLGGRPCSSKTVLKRLCSVKELVAKERKAVRPAWHRGTRL